MAGIAVWMAIWWISETVPLAVTALLPVVLFPTMGIMSGKQVSPIYFNHIIFLFMGGFLVALAMQRWNLHKRIALRVLKWFGVKPGNILLGFMIATAFLSMWISNTATTMMMVPIALSVIMRMEEMLDSKNIHKFSTGIFLGIAYSASIGGIATLVGTPPNLSFARILTILFPNAPEISFASWFLFAFPISVTFILILWIVLRRLSKPFSENPKIDNEIFSNQYKGLGRMSFEERVVLYSFIALMILWLTRADISIGAFSVPGWSRVFQTPGFINDGTVAMFIALMLFIVPSKNGKERIISWETATKLPWHIILLFGGGFALASGFKESGLAVWLGQQFTGVASLSPLLIVISICLFVTFLTELTSNTATAEMFLPILGSLAVAIQINPLFLMLPATLSCSFAFMLPVATPPNAIIFGTNQVQIRDMVRVGVWLNFIGVMLITVAVFLSAKIAFGIDLSVMPGWALQ